MTLWKWLPGQLAEQGRSKAQIGSNRFSRITAKTVWSTQGRCGLNMQAMQQYHRRSLPQQSPGAGQSKLSQTLYGPSGLQPQWLKQLRGFSCVASHACSGRAMPHRHRLPAYTTRAGLLTASRSSSPLGALAPYSQAAVCSNHLQSLASLLHPRREQPCKVASLRAPLTSDAATRKHNVPGHLQERKQNSPRSNAYSSAVAQAEEDYEASHLSQQRLAELPQQRSSNGAQLGGSMTATGARQALVDTANDGLANEEQVQKLEGALAVASASVEGTIQNVTYKDEKSGYTVLKVAALHTAGEPPEQRTSAAQRPSRAGKGVDPKSIVTVVGNLPHAAKGQQLRFVGDWVLHPKHSWQLKATAYEEVVPRSPQAVAAYLASTIDGVGFTTATKLVHAFGTSVLSLMDQPDCVERLSEVDNIGRTRAANIKQLWDASRELREMRQFVKTLGLTGRLAQMLVERHGKYTEARLKQDPYSCLHGMPGVTFRVAEDLAWAVNAPTDLPSRGATAFLHTLQLASEKAGHTHLPWEVLIMHTQRLLSSSGRPWKDAERLKDIAQHLQKSGHIVVEAPQAELQTVPKPEGRELPALPQIFGGSMWGSASDEMAGSSSRGDSLQDHLQRESLEKYLTSRIQGVGPNRAKQLVELHGVAIVQQLDGDAEAALKALVQIRGVGRKTAEQMLRSWAQNSKKVGPWKDPSAGMQQGAEALESSESASASDEDLQWPWDPQSRCYLADMHETEVRVAAALSRIAAQEEQSFDGGEERVNKWDKARREKERKEEGKESPLSEGQKAAVMRASRAPLIVLTGGPGCGKTFATKAIVQLWQSQQKDIRLAAPTGRAAERLQEEANKRGPRAQIKATTIHRLLNYRSWSQRRQGQEKDSSEGGDDLEGFFAFNAQKTLDAPSGKLSILVDETSMLDMSLASSLLDAIPTDIPVQLVLVGDADQLPPVSAGSFLSAAIDSGVVPVVDLREVFRQAQGSDIVKAAHAVHAGRMPSLTRIDPAQPSEESKERQALWVVPQSMADIEDEVVRTVQSSIMTDRGVDVKRDLQVLTPMRKGPAGVQSLNARLQELLNPPQKGKGEIRVSSAADTPQILRVGDRVIQAVNNYDKEVFNGDPGYVVSVDAAARRVKVQFPSSGAESGAGREVEYTGAELWEVELAWATTVHKAQGSESKAVIVVLSPAHRPLLTRRLFYTAITRAREAVVVVGAEAAMRTALQGTQGDVRLSSLHGRLAAAADRLNLPRCTPVVYRRPVAEGQGFAAAGPVDDAVSQKVSDSVHQAQEEQHLDDLAASTRQRQEAVQELPSSSTVYNNGSSAAGALQRADSAVSAHLPGTSDVHAGQQNPLPQEAGVPPSFSSSNSEPAAIASGRQGPHEEANGSGSGAAGAVPVPAAQQEQSAGSTHGGDPRRSNAPQHHRSRAPLGARKSSLQGAKLSHGGRPNSAQS